MYRGSAQDRMLVEWAEMKARLEAVEAENTRLRDDVRTLRVILSRNRTVGGSS